MVKAEEMTDFDFLISVVGPSTSVREQQLQSMAYGVEEYNLSAEALYAVDEYTKLILEGPESQTTFGRMTELLEKANEQGWNMLLDDTDICSSKETIKDLWVRRHAYDPGPELSTFSQPFLAIYGENDWIVPHKENVTRLEVLFSGDRQELLTTVVAPFAGHGTETDGEYVTLSDNKSYWRFFRISPWVMIQIVDFLRTNGFVE